MALYRHVGIEVTIGNVNNAVIPEETSEMDDPAITPPTQGQVFAVKLHEKPCK